MENADIKMYYTKIIVICCVNIVSCLIIISMLVTAAYADVALGKPLYAQYPGYFIGVGIAVFDLVFSFFCIIFTKLSQTIYADKIIVSDLLLIATFVIFVTGMLIMLAAVILVAIGLRDVTYCISYGSSDWVATCRTNLGYYGVGIVLMVGMVVIAILGIISSVKVFSILNKNVPPMIIPATGGSKLQQVM